MSTAIGPKSGSPSSSSWSALPQSGFTGSAANSTGYGFSIPGNATVTGVAVSYYRSNTLQAGGCSATTNLLNVTGTSQRTDNMTNGSGGNYTQGGDGVLWGATSITPAMVNSASFGCSFVVNGFNASTTTSANGSISSVTMTVYYTAGGQKYVVSCVC